MCRGFQQNERDHHNRLLNIKAFYLRFYLSTNPESLNLLPLPDSLTLCYLPRISGSPLEINHSKIKPHSPSFVTLHRLVSPPTSIIIANNNNNNNNNNNTNRGGSVYFGSRDRVKASQGARFEVFLREHKVFKGIFRKDWDDPWKMECSCVLEDGVLQLQEVVKEAEVCVAADVVMREKVEVVMKRKRRSRSAGTILEEIPEECELDDDSCCSCCSSSSSSSSSSGEEEILDMGSSSHFHHVKEEDDIAAAEMEMEMEGLSWAIDVGIWVMCLGVGFLVSKAASSNTFRRRTTKRSFL